MQENEPKKVPLKLLMDPRHVQDFNTVRQQYGYDQPAPMSPEFGHVLIDALNAPKGKGNETLLILTKLFYQIDFQL